MLCDLMMPNMNGYEVLDKLKNDDRTSHIPVVLLTAKADDASRLEGLRKGADAYLVKPFNKNELLIRLEKLVQLRRKLQQRYQGGSPLLPAGDEALQKEDDFINKVEGCVLRNLDNSEYGIVHLSRDIGLSRTQLHNKLKTLTGVSTSIFVRSIRLRQGKQLLENSHLTIAEIAYKTGFNDPNYFTRCFTEEYGEAPSFFRK